MTRRWFFAFVLIISSLTEMVGLSAEPRVLHDSGQTIPIEPYLAPIKPKASSPAIPQTPPALTATGFGLPVETPSMSPGKVTQRELPALQGKMAGANPLFLIGADRWSLQWLKQNQRRLSELHAVGLVISVVGEGDLNILRQAAGKIRLIPASGEAIANHLGLEHYPVLIVPPGVAYQ